MHRLNKIFILYTSSVERHLLIKKVFPFVVNVLGLEKRENKKHPLFSFPLYDLCKCMGAYTHMWP